ncbi:hypothetical protein ANN_27169 [Periplaneta americana]|uniref:DUF4817 domain-containing protein n=1 Tax=Periplaneta americana TaxID=6978 RepID=A0ABQ8RXE0_PERAM|nr:hypothetical protein ANN_27169 [Periplaneta americana]
MGTWRPLLLTGGGYVPSVINVQRHYRTNFGADPPRGPTIRKWYTDFKASFFASGCNIIRTDYSCYRLQLDVLRRNFCISMQTLIQNDDEFIPSVVFSDEPLFIFLVSTEQSDGITVFRISPTESLMLHRCRTGSISLQSVPQTTTYTVAMTAIDPSSSFVPISLQCDVIVVHRSDSLYKDFEYDHYELQILILMEFYALTGARRKEVHFEIWKKSSGDRSEAVDCGVGCYVVFRLL